MGTVSLSVAALPPSLPPSLPTCIYENVEACYKIVQEFSLFVYRSKIEYSFDGPTIVYCPTKKATETVVSELSGNLFCAHQENDQL